MHLHYELLEVDDKKIWSHLGGWYANTNDVWKW